MVGFGSALRLSRRRGWEEAYVDYESLKLLLSQIEAVYEESTTNGFIGGMGRGHDFGFYDEETSRLFSTASVGGGTSNSTRNQGRGTASGHNASSMKIDFRDELFLESDSSDAYESLSEEEFDEHDHKHDDHNTASYDEDSIVYDHYEDYEDQIASHGHSHGHHPPKSNKDTNSVLPSDANFNFSYSAPSYGSHEVNDSTNGSTYESIHYASSAGRSYGSDSFGRGQFNDNVNTSSMHHQYDYRTDDEKHPILISKKRSNSIVGGGGKGFGHRINPSSSSAGSFIQLPVQNKTRRKSISRATRNMQEKRKKRKLRRRRKVRVRPPIRIAHTKARAITERFLGLLRAEIDKICLFTHSRMGELTDTIGSLRFPCEQMDFDRQEDDHLGIHASASSSSDEGMQYMPTSADEGSLDEEKFMKPPLFPRRRNDVSIGIGNHSRDEKMSEEEESYMNSPAWRLIKIIEELRLAKPTFQRSDDILGEDFLLLSAVDEADAYTTVGVEFLHLLKFICVNAIAVRKLCRKHDRLLASRMLGGYYNRLDHTQPNSDVAIGGFRNRRSNTTLSFVNRRQQGTTLEASQHKLTGVYDSMVLFLANNSVAEDLSESLYHALSEYEVSRRRADALNNLQEAGENKISYDNVAEVGKEVSCYHFPSPRFSLSSPENNAVLHDDEKETSDEALSTSSSISLTRFRFAMASVMSLREAAMEKFEPYNEFFSRSMMAIDDSHIVGEAQGFHGCSREALDILVGYNPDFALLYDTHILKKSLSIEADGDFMSYRLCNDPDSVDESLMDDSDRSLTALSIRSHIPTVQRKAAGHCMLRVLNFSSIALTTMNYYIIVPSAAAFCHNLNGKYIHSVLLICAPSVACLLTSLLQAFTITAKVKKNPEKVFYKHLILSALFPLLGNSLYSVAYEREAIWLAVVGRFIIGLSSSDVINKEIVISTAKTNDTISEMSILRKIQLLFIFVGLLFGPLLDTKETHIEIHHHMFNISFQTLPGYVMFFIWTIHFLVLILSPLPKVSNIQEKKWPGDHFIDVPISVSESEEGPNPVKPFRQHSRNVSDQTKLDYYMKKLDRNISEASYLESKEYQESNPTQVQKNHSKKMKVVLHRTKKLVSHNIALPITMALHIFSKLTIEIIMSSCVMITHRYFRWSGAQAGYFLAILASSFIPLNVIASIWSRRYSERSILKKSLMMTLCASVFKINYQSLYVLIFEIDSIFRQDSVEESTMSRYYDWQAGIYQYCIGTAIMLISMVLIEGASLSLMSKVSSDRLNSSAINCSILTPLLGCLGKVLGGTVLIIIGFSHRLIYSDMVNSIAFLLILLSICSYHVVKKHYFFLYGSI